MLKLKRLQILGFKSFCDRTELKFHGDGVAAIIGPNGCGKSNISDAISWVLGEQSAKTLRGSRMEDVIFAGTRDRKPTGMAEVSLTLIDPEVCNGADAGAPTEIDIRDDLSESNISDDWDEASIRARAAAATDQAVEDAQPGKTEEVEVIVNKCTPVEKTGKRTVCSYVPIEQEITVNVCKCVPVEQKGERIAALFRERRQIDVLPEDLYPANLDDARLSRRECRDDRHRDAA